MYVNNYRCFNRNLCLFMFVIVISKNLLLDLCRLCFICRTFYFLCVVIFIMFIINAYLFLLNNIMLTISCWKPIDNFGKAKK